MASICLGLNVLTPLISYYVYEVFHILTPFFADVEHG